MKSDFILTWMKYNLVYNNRYWTYLQRSTDVNQRHHESTEGYIGLLIDTFLCFGGKRICVKLSIISQYYLTYVLIPLSDSYDTQGMNRGGIIVFLYLI